MFCINAVHSALTGSFRVGVLAVERWRMYTSMYRPLATPQYLVIVRCAKATRRKTAHIEPKIATNSHITNSDDDDASCLLGKKSTQQMSDTNATQRSNMPFQSATFETSQCGTSRPKSNTSMKHSARTDHPENTPTRQVRVEQRAIPKRPLRMGNIPSGHVRIEQIAIIKHTRKVVTLETLFQSDTPD
jgi:hypothetical protein